MFIYLALVSKIETLNFSGTCISPKVLTYLDIIIHFICFIEILVAYFSVSQIRGNNFLLPLYY